jgi:transcriptional regulator with XRE-family HTH domain
MKDLSLSNRIKELRTQLGYSQAELADNARLSLRTVQRIESGEVKPRGYTLQSIAAALKISADELTEWEQKSDKLFLIMLNLSALCFVMFPLLGTLIPLLLWVIKKNDIKNSDQMGRKILNFQITWLLIFGAGMIAFVQIGLTGKVFTFTNYLLFVCICYGFNVLSIIVNAMRVQQEKQVKYFLAIPFFK